MKPYNSEIIKAMAAHSDECAVYASAMKWDWLRRQKIEDITKELLEDDCGLCERFDDRECKFDNNKCFLKQASGGNTCRNNIFDAIWYVYREGHQQAFTEAANNLYYQIRSIIDDFYKTEPKNEVFYHTGQKFKKKDGQEYMLYLTGDFLATMVSENGRNCQTNPVQIDDADKITEEQFKKLCGEYSTFTLISDKK